MAKKMSTEMQCRIYSITLPIKKTCCGHKTSIFDFISSVDLNMSLSNGETTKLFKKSEEVETDSSDWDLVIMRIRIGPTERIWE